MLYVCRCVYELRHGRPAEVVLQNLFMSLALFQVSVCLLVCAALCMLCGPSGFSPCVFTLMLLYALSYASSCFLIVSVALRSLHGRDDHKNY